MPGRAADNHKLREIGVATLRRSSILRCLSEGELEGLRLAMSAREYTRREMVFEPGHGDQDLYVVATGSARAYMSAPDGREFTILCIRADEGTGTGSLIGPRAVPSCSLQVTRDASLIGRIARVHFDRLVEAHDDLRTEIETLKSEWIRRLCELSGSLALQPLDVRLARLLSRQARMEPDGSVDLIHEELASMVGGSREEVNRVLHRFRVEGFITSQPHRHGIVVSDVDRLNRYGEDFPPV